jgi:hypothetical protein
LLLLARVWWCQTTPATATATAVRPARAAVESLRVNKAVQNELNGRADLLFGVVAVGH